MRLKTKQIIVQNTLQLVKRDGPSKVSVAEVAAISGISRKTFYDYFKNVEDLLTNVLNSIYSSWKKIIIANKEEFKNDDDALHPLLMGLAEFMFDNRELILILTDSLDDEIFLREIASLLKQTNIIKYADRFKNKVVKEIAYRSHASSLWMISIEALKHPEVDSKELIGLIEAKIKGVENYYSKSINMKKG